MNPTRLALATAACLLTGLVAFLLLGSREGARRPSSAAVSAPADRHYVSPQQLAQSPISDGTPISAIDQDGQARSWQSLSEGQPLVLVFVKDACPCSVEFEPFFHRLACAYTGSVRFVAVIDGDVAVARRFADANDVPYPVLADGSAAIIRRFRAEHGATVALLSPSGKVEAVWPGCSVAMMRELSERIAQASNAEEKSIELAGLPGALTAGCRYRP